MIISFVLYAYVFFFIDLQAVHQFECCEDIKGHTLDAGLVFKYCIKYLKKHFYKEMKKTFCQIQNSDIGYVVTVPDVWGEIGKTFMRKAAVKVMAHIF